MATSSNVCSCAELAASNQALRLRCCQLEEENVRLRERLAAASAVSAPSVHSAVASAASGSSAASRNGDVNDTATVAEEDGELTVEEILRSTAQEMAREAAVAAAAPPPPPPPALSIEDDLKAAAEEALGHQGYVYNERTGLYFDTGTGYYYDPTEQLFYNSRTGVYYSYDSQTQQYVFHSRVPLSELKEQAELIAVMTGLQHRPPPRPGDAAERMLTMEEEATSKRHSRHKKLKKMKRDRREHRPRRRTSTSQSRSRSRSRGSVQSGQGEGSDEQARRRRRKQQKKQKKREKRKEEKRAAKKRRRSVEAEPAVTITAAPQLHRQQPQPDRAAEDYYPPCIRMLVLESPSLPVGSLRVVTRDGATLGRDPAAMPTVLLAGDSEVSKLHCRIVYSEPDRQFHAVDMASHTGTRIGDRPLSHRREVSQPAPLWHGCRLRVGGTEFLCHIHESPGGATCSRCEPGLAPPGPTAASAHDNAPVPMATLDRRARLRQLKAKHGLLASAAAPPPGYSDRAEARRRLVGADDTRHLSGDVQAVSVAVDAAAAVGVALHVRDESNPGVRLLAKMGWRPGDGIGRGVRAERSLREPLGAAPRLGERAGLGSELDRPVSAAAGGASSAQEAERRRARVAMTTRERYNRLLEEAGAAADDFG